MLVRTLPIRWMACWCATLFFAGQSTQTLIATELPNGTQLEKVDFERHVMGLLSKTGCNNGSCHGSFQGKNGFRLSLFGLDADRDYNALTRELHGRRANVRQPDESLLLQKAAGLTSHDGGIRFTRDSWQYGVIREWIAQGMPRSKEGSEIRELTIDPPLYMILQPGQSSQVRVTARFADGSKEDVTPFCDFRMQDDAVANVNVAGGIEAKQPGDSGFNVLYRGKVASIRVLVASSGKQNADFAQFAHNAIDKEVNNKLRLLNVAPSGLTDDADFLRRVTIDTIGALPSPDEIRKFLADRSPDKRARKIEELLKHPLHGAIWATKFSDITGNNTLTLEQPAPLQVPRSQQWHDWFRVRIEQNMPYDQIVKGVLTATSLEGQSEKEWIAQTNKIDEDALKSMDTSEYAKRKTLDLFWRTRQAVPSNIWGEKVAAAFLGVRLECAQCHKHPTDQWTQADYRSFANIFSNVTFSTNQYSSSELRQMVVAENKKRTEANKDPKNRNNLITLREMFVAAEPVRGNRLMTDPDTDKPLTPKAIAGPEFPAAKGVDLRVSLFDWMASPENPFFARSFVNRVWAHYFGVGIVDPVDDFSQANPPTNAALLDLLATEFVKSGYDIRKLETLILNSHTYQRTSKPNESNKFDTRNYSHGYIRPMMAEVVVDIINDAIGVTETLPSNLPKDKRITEIGTTQLGNQNIAYVLQIFGRPPRTTACDCERAMDPALPQTLFRMTDTTLLRKMTVKSNRLWTLLNDKSMNDEQVFTELVLGILSRYPTADEMQLLAKFREREPDRAAAFNDIFWALLNTREFILNH
ncbi:MAG: DUF1549 and DUF1553 domain-containing protein [Zavarzinella sp.]